MRVSNTKMGKFRVCPYAHYLDYVRNIQPKQKPWPLIDGEAVHLGIQLFNERYEKIYPKGEGNG